MAQCAVSATGGNRATRQPLLLLVLRWPQQQQRQCSHCKSYCNNSIVVFLLFSQYVRESERVSVAFGVATVAPSCGALANEFLIWSTSKQASIWRPFASAIFCPFVRPSVCVCVLHLLCSYAEFPRLPHAIRNIRSFSLTRQITHVPIHTDLNAKPEMYF